METGTMLQRTQQIFDEQRLELAQRTDRMFAWLMIAQWIFSMLFAVTITPYTWVGDQNAFHIHLYAALLLGGLFALFPVGLVYYQPGATMNRHVIAISQMLFSGLLVHLTGGRIETHFHVFGSLAFLAIYRDWRVVLTASAVTAADHLLRGYFFPESVYGVLSATPWRAFEHAGWVVFEDIFLIYSIAGSIRGMWTNAVHAAKLEHTLHGVEEAVVKRTSELVESQKMVLNQQQSMIASAKHTALGEMAGQIAHEINTPLGAIVLTAQGLSKKAAAGTMDAQDVIAKMEFMLQVTNKLARIIGSMRKLAGHGANEQIREVKVEDLVQDTLLLCEGRFKRSSIDFQFVNQLGGDLNLQCRPNEISQVLINLLNNAHDALKDAPEKWVRLFVEKRGGKIAFRVVDSGPGVSPINRNKLFLPHFTTKSLDSGTGFGLSICKKLVSQHQGEIFLDASQRETTFVMELPMEQTEAIAMAVAA